MAIINIQWKRDRARNRQVSAEKDRELTINHLDEVQVQLLKGELEGRIETEDTEGKYLGVWQII